MFRGLKHHFVKFFSNFKLELNFKFKLSRSRVLDLERKFQCFSHQPVPWVAPSIEYFECSKQTQVLGKNENFDYHTLIASTNGANIPDAAVYIAAAAMAIGTGSIAVRLELNPWAPSGSFRNFSEFFGIFGNFGNFFENFRNNFFFLNLV